VESDSKLQVNLPLTEVSFFILLSLAARPRHGYAIMKDVRDISAHRVELSTGTLYGAIKRMLEQGWILRSDDPQADTTARERKIYRLTSLGRQILEAETSRLEGLVTAAKLRTVGENT
jgi:DNA-binding PadR family transcriptional regulator